MKSRILVPVDFTDVSLNAFRYANQLAYRMGHDLTLVHVFSGSISVDGPLIVKAGQSRIDVLRDRLKLYTKWYPNQSEKLKNVNTDFEVLQGDTVDQLLKYATTHDVKMIVAGTRDKHTKIDKWLGSVSFDLCRKAIVPVLFIPKNEVLGSIKNVVIASDYHCNDSSVLEQYMGFNKAFNAKTYFVHIQQPGDIKGENHQAQIREIFDIYAPSNQPFEMIELPGKKVVLELFNYGKQIKADLIVFVPERRPAIQALLHSSLTEKALMQNSIPIMIYHSIAN